MSARERIVRWRHDLHQIPETAFTEHRTAAYCAEVLRGLGFEVVTGVGGTGVVGSLTANRGAPQNESAVVRAIGLRAELDALPLSENAPPDRAHASRHDGVMHACGHDGHLAMVLGAAAELAENGGFDGTLRIVLQPAEEPGRGAQAMIDDGVLERFPMQAMFGLHNLPGLPAGHLHLSPGSVMAGEDNFAVQVIGRGGHASAPHLVIDPLVIAAEIVTALQTVVSRDLGPAQQAVLSCTDLRTDGARNAIPTNVWITGDTRSFDPAVSQLLERRITELARGIAAAHGARCEVTYTREFAPTVNDQRAVDRGRAAAIAALGADRVAFAEPIMASEDFGVFADHVPAAFGFLGTGLAGEPGGTALHSRDYDFNDEVLEVGVAWFAELARGS